MRYTFICKQCKMPCTVFSDEKAGEIRPAECFKCGCKEFTQRREEAVE